MLNNRISSYHLLSWFCFNMFVPQQVTVHTAEIMCPGACESFDRFIDGRTTAHCHYDFQLVRATEYDISHVGFIESSNQYYTTSNNELYVMDIDDEFTKSELVQTHRFHSSINSVTQNPNDTNLFAVSTDDNITILRIGSEMVELHKKNFPSLVSWSASNSIIELESNGRMNIHDLETMKISSTTSGLIDARVMCVHPTEPYVLMGGNTLGFIDLRVGVALNNIQIKPGLSSLSWMPGDINGTIIGYQDGSIDLFSISDRRSVVTQLISNKPISAVEFCPARLGTALISSDTDIMFANLRAWGFGHMTVTRTHQGHIGVIKEAKWSKKNNYRVISCDDKRMLNIFQMSENYLPVYTED